MSSSYYRVVRVQWEAREQWDDPAPLKQRRKREAEKQEQESRLLEIRIAKEEQHLTQIKESRELRKREGEIRLDRLAVGRAREAVLLVMNVVLALCALVLLVVAMTDGGVYAVGGSGLTACASICGLINLTSGNRLPFGGNPTN